MSGIVFKFNQNTLRGIGSLRPVLASSLTCLSGSYPLLCSHHPRERASRCRDWCRIWQKAGRAGALLLPPDPDAASPFSTSFTRATRVVGPFSSFSSLSCSCSFPACSASSTRVARDGGSSAAAAADPCGPSVGEETGEEPLPPPAPPRERG